MWPGVSLSRQLRSDLMRMSPSVAFGPHHGGMSGWNSASTTCRSRLESGAEGRAARHNDRWERAGTSWALTALLVSPPCMDAAPPANKTRPAGPLMCLTLRCCNSAWAISKSSRRLGLRPASPMLLPSSNVILPRAEERRNSIRVLEIDDASQERQQPVRKPWLC